MITIPGVNFVTAITVIAETGGFANVGNRRHLVSYVGLDVIMKESGTLTFRRNQVVNTSGISTLTGGRYDLNCHLQLWPEKIRSNRHHPFSSYWL
ncbi:transposase [Mucilaginibacter sp. SP1R1]|uniref:transposase n=1 Tax=Mucilaginibacter sp. SP1R1 TaxID=2723091 RepID=UPI00161802BF|nr:hypothetical protein [Mucilaginibacter sp. SP1R1]